MLAMQSTNRSWLPALAIAALWCTGDAGARNDAWHVELVPLEQDVWLVRRPEPLREPVEANALFIVNADDVIVFEGGGAPIVAERTIALIRSVTDKPVTHVINSHWHGDHNLGNQVYRDEFPGVRFVGHPETQKAMTGRPMSYVQRYVPMIEGVIRDWTAQQERGELDERRVAMLPDLHLMREELAKVTIVPPDLLVDERLVLERGAREIHVVHLGRGNTPGDLVLWLPRERILASGDLVVHPIPYGFGSFPADWIQTLEKLAAFDFEVLVPGHGELQRDREYIRRLQGMLTEVRRQVGESVAAGHDLETTRKELDLSAFEQEFAGDDEDAKLKFDAWWKQPIARSAWLEARGEEIRQGASDETG
jgi:glyoxylase-like metal-dependent hydrolase (beta-lactamase superfamily II)